MANVAGVLKREQVYAKIKSQIINGKVQGGACLNERSLSEKLGVGRGTIRESLLRLANEGFIESVPGIGSYVKQFSVKEIKDLFYIREVLEGAAARFAAERAGRIDINELEQFIIQLEVFANEKDEAGVRRIDMALHRKIADIAGNELLKSMIYNNLGLRMMINDNTPISDIGILQHKQILEAIVKGDGALAEQLMKAHIAGSSDKLLNQLHQNNKNIEKEKSEENV